MPQLNQLSSARLVKAMLIGEPGSGKTGSLAALANAGYHLRLINLDPEGNVASLAQFADGTSAANVHVVSLEDRMKVGSKRTEVIGVPSVFPRAFNLLDWWKGKEPDGTEFDLGKPSEWGADTVLAIDGLSGLNTAIMNWIMAADGKMGQRPGVQHWEAASSCEGMFLQKAAGQHIGCHVLVMSHIKLIGPPEIEEKDSEDVREGKRAQAEKIPYRHYPRAIGRELPRHVGGLFPYNIVYRKVAKGRTVERKMLLAPQMDIDVKVPLVGLDAELPIESGLLTVFEKVKVGRG